MPPITVNKASSWVEPAAPVKAETVYLSAVDNQCAQVYPCGFWFFPMNKDMKHPMVHYEQMKQGLARLLYQQPLNAGILRQDSRSTFRVEIPPAPHAGARFHYQDISNDPSFPSIKQLASLNYPVIDGEQDGLHRLRPDDFPTSSDGDPVFVCQLTRLQDGMVVFATCTHLIGDLLQPRVTLAGWAEQVRLVADAADKGLPQPPIPRQLPAKLYDRSRLSPVPERELTYAQAQEVCNKNGDWVILDPTDPVAAAERLRSTFPSAYLTPAERDHEDDLLTSTGGMWTISLKNLNDLSALARQHTDRKLSTVDVVNAFIWQRYYIAKYALGKHLSPNDAAPDRPFNPTMVFPADIRGRMNPPLLQMYLGAAVDVFKASVPEHVLLPESDSPEALGRSLAAAALALRVANSTWDEQRYMDFIQLSVSTPTNLRFLPQGPLDLLVTDHTRNTALRNADWGPGLGLTPELRQPYFGRVMPAGEATLMPRCNNGDLEVMVTAERVVMKRLLKDEVWKRFTKPLFVAHNVVEALVSRHSTAASPMSRL